VNDIRKAMKEAMGPGNFRNLFAYAPGGKKDGLHIIPVSKVSARDDFFNIQNVSRDDVLAAYRVRPQLMGLVPSNSGGFGMPISVARVFARNELESLQAKFFGNQRVDWSGGGQIQALHHPWGERRVSRHRIHPAQLVQGFFWPLLTSVCRAWHQASRPRGR